MDVDPPEWGVAVASKFLAVGAVVPWAKAGVGAVATQALANVAYGPDGLRCLAAAAPADEVLRRLTEADDGRSDRQLGIVDATGEAATFTGDDCFDWAGGRAGRFYACQGNILAGSGVIDAMSAAFETTEGELAARLLESLRAGDDAGGDRRGRQSAALLVVRRAGGYGGGTDVSVDLRVDDHVSPVAELIRLFGIHRLLLPRPEDLSFQPLVPELVAELAGLLQRAGYDPGGEDAASVRRALFAYVGAENLEERWSDDENLVERGVVDHLRAQGA